MITSPQNETEELVLSDPLAIAIVTLDISSYVNPLLELAAQLKDMGYSITFMCPSDGLSALTETRGFGCLKIENGSQLLSAADPSSSTTSALASFVSNEKPAAVFVMAEMHEHIIKLLAINAAIIITDTHLATRYRPGIPPPDIDYLPKQSMRSQWICWYYWQRQRVRRRLGRNLRRIKQGRQERIRALELYAQQMNLDTSALFDLNQWHFIDYRNVPLLRLATPALDFPGAPEPSSLYSGALVRSSFDRHASSSRDAEWMSFVNREKSAQRQILMVCLGSFQSSETFLEKVIAASQGQAWSVLMAIGPDCSPALTQSLPDNVKAYRWLPQREVLDWVDGMVCAAGNATINECITCSVPMLCYPMDRMDQYGMAARIVYYGLGISGDIKSGSVTSIRSNIENLLQERSYTRAINEMKTQFENFYDTNPPGEAILKAIDKAKKPTS